MARPRSGQQSLETKGKVKNDSVVYRDRRDKVRAWSLPRSVGEDRGEVQARREGWRARGPSLLPVDLRDPREGFRGQDSFCPDQHLLRCWSGWSGQGA